MTSANPLWFIDRSAGEVTLLLLTGVLVLGIVRAAVPNLYPLPVEGLHTNTALMVMVFGGLHVVAAVVDPFARLRLLDAVIPFVASYRSLWLGLGVVSGYLYVATVLLSWPARRLPRSSWLWIHRLMYGAWLVAVVHSLGTGSDARNDLFIVLDVIAVTSALAAFLGLRVAEGWNSHPRRWATLAIFSVLVVLATGIWAATGPLQAGWARASGTPADLLKSR